MEPKELMELQIWEFIDGTASPDEMTRIEKLIATQEEWKAKYHELLETQQWLKSVELEEPSMRFTKNVMEGIAKHHIAPAAGNYINKKIIWGIAAFFITLIVAFTVYAIAQIDWSATSTTELPGQAQLEKIDLSKVFNNTFVNIFMMANAILGLMLLDRYLANQRNKHHKEA